MQTKGVTALPSWPASGRGRGFAPGRGRGLSWAGGEERVVGASRQTESDRHCFRCGGVGHLSRQCPSHPRGRQPDLEGGGPGQVEMWGAVPAHSSQVRPGNRNRVVENCFRCDKDGHRSAECTNERQPGDFKQRNKVQSDEQRHYEPEESLEENLYDHGISSGINFRNYKDIPIKITGTSCPPKISDFSDANLSDVIMENIRKSHYTTPTPIQENAIPIILAGRDIMGCAQTGSGKTAAFLIPIIQRLVERGATARQTVDRDVTICYPEVVVMSPTRELATQIKDEARKFCAGSGLKSLAVYGGTSVRGSVHSLSQGCNILVATPGRLGDFVERGYINYSRVEFLVLDEADRMLDMGFKEDIQKIIRNRDMPRRGERKTLMFSATFPNEIQTMAQDFMENYIFLAVGQVGGACSDVTQSIIAVSQYEKREKLLEIIRENIQKSPKNPVKTLVFVEAKKTADFIAAYLSQSIESCATSIHGDRLQPEREKALKDFKTGRNPVLVATAVAARGLDIK